MPKTNELFIHSVHIDQGKMRYNTLVKDEVRRVHLDQLTLNLRILQANMTNLFV